MRIIWAEYQRIKQLKKIDIQVCSFCQRLNILNLGWKTFGEFYCRTCEKGHTLCPQLCYKAALNILGCELYKREKSVVKEVVKPNRTYDYCSCYLCGKELAGAGKTGKIKNRNNPSFWGISTKFRILCLKCLGKKYYEKLSTSKRKTWNKYVKRGYI